jgi:hypothetical protein
MKKRNKNKNKILVHQLKIIIKREKQIILKYQYKKVIQKLFIWIKQKKKIKNLNKIIVAQWDELFYFVCF